MDVQIDFLLKIEFRVLIGDFIISRERYTTEKLKTVKWEDTDQWDDHVY